MHNIIGALDFTYSEAQVTNAILKNARTYLAADASKWTRAAAVRVGPLPEFSQLATDQLPDDPEIIERLQVSGVQVIVYKEE